jgi:hypothetical protein
MPYSAKKTGKNEITVMKKDSGEVVGHTTPAKYNAYMAALHIHDQPEHKCDGGCVGYAKGGWVPSADAKDLADIAESSFPLAADPEAMQAGLKSNIPQGGSLLDHIGVHLPSIQKTSGEGEYGVGPAAVLQGALRELTNPDTSYTPVAPMATGKVKRMSEGGIAGAPEKNDPSDIPEEIKEYVKESHKADRESRPDENWRIKPAEKPSSVAPYKRDEEETASEDHGEGPSTSGIPHFDEGSPGMVGDDPNAILQELAPQGSGTIAPSPDMPVQPPDQPPIQATTQPPAAPVAPVARTTSPASPVTDQTFMDRANKMLGLGPDQQAAFMNLLGNNTQKGQIGAGIAGIGDAIASGGTLGKVNPGALNRSEDLIQNKTKEGIEGMQTIRGNQEKAFDVAQKLEAQDPKSPLSQYAQKAYGDVGKKLGLDLSHASASLIADVAGKGVEELNTEYQGQLKQMGLQLQKEQVEATKANQEAERRQAALTAQQTANKTLADQGLLKKAANQITPSGRASQKELEREAGLGAGGPVKVDSQAQYDALPPGTHYVDSYGTEKVKK